MQGRCGDIRTAVKGSDEYKKAAKDAKALIAEIKDLTKKAANAPVSTAAQYKAIIADLKAEWNIRTPLKDVPKGLLKLCRTYNMQLSDSLIDSYNI